MEVVSHVKQMDTTKLFVVLQLNIVMLHNFHAKKENLRMPLKSMIGLQSALMNQKSKNN